MTPPMAASPYKALALPRNTSMRSICDKGTSSTCSAPIESICERTPSTMMTTLMLFWPRKKNDVVVPGPPFRPNSKPASPCSNSARLGAWDLSMSWRVMTETDVKACDSGCSTRAAEITTGLISRDWACAPAAMAKDKADNAGAKPRAVTGRFFMKNEQVKCPHRLPRQCMGFTTCLATGHLVGRYPG